MGHLKSLGAFLSDGDEDEIHKRVGHFTLIEVRRGKKNWSELINGALPIAVDRLLEFFGYLRDSYPLLSRPKRKKVKSYIANFRPPKSAKVRLVLANRAHCRSLR
jgi:hypothetical protein